MTTDTTVAQEAGHPPAVAALEHLTGRCRGTVTWLGDATLDVILGPDCRLRVVEAAEPGTGADRVARLHRDRGSFEIQTLNDCAIWVNKKRIVSGRLQDGDMIEFCEQGPISRFALHGDGRATRQTLGEILSDAVAYFRASRRPVGTRTFNTGSQIIRRLLSETTLLFRFSMIAALIVLGVLTYQQSRISSLLQQRIDSGSAQLEDFSRTLARTREEALTPSDLEALRIELGQRVDTATGRLEELERRSTASARIIAESADSVVFLQGSYGFLHEESGRMLRQVVGEDGTPRLHPAGRPLLSLDGKGAVAERQFIGTGFVIGTESLIITNRHVGLPWDKDANVNVLSGQGLKPVMVKFVAYLPGKAEAWPIEIVKIAHDTDLALLRISSQSGTIPGLELADETPNPGDEVIVMGYPTGLRSMLAQAGREFIEQLQKANDAGFWSVAARLAETGRIVPLASRGIIGRVGPQALVYDAETTHGGSGGPVLDIGGRVIAVNAAIIPEYGGSNLGVPAARVGEFLERDASN